MRAATNFVMLMLAEVSPLEMPVLVRTALDALFFSSSIVSTCESNSNADTHIDRVSLSWPIRRILSSACNSSPGVQGRSKKIMVLACVRVIPTPPAPKVVIKTEYNSCCGTRVSLKMKKNGHCETFCSFLPCNRHSQTNFVPENHPPILVVSLLVFLLLTELLSIHNLPIVYESKRLPWQNW